MTYQPHIKARPIIPQQVTPIDEKKKRVGEVLRHVDQLIKSNDFQKALIEINSAKEIDAQNIYIIALEERITNLLAEKKKQKEETELKAQIQKKEEIELKQNPSKIQTQPSVPTPRLNSQEIASICIKKAIENPQKPPVPTSFVEPKVTNPQTKYRPKIVMIDDDDMLRSVLCSIIESGGFEAISLSTSDEAYTLLRKFTPDAVLCDINLETSTMGGFTFFEKIQELKHLRQIPFIFLSGLNDDVLVRAGKEMGADDYLTKPIREENLLSTIRGKIKRFARLKQDQPANSQITNSTREFRGIPV